MTLDSVDDDERPIEEGLAIAKYLADSGLVDMIHFGRGAYSCRWRMVSSVYQPVGFDLDAAPKVREMIGDLPSWHTGSSTTLMLLKRPLRTV